MSDIENAMRNISLAFGTRQGALARSFVGNLCVFEFGVGGNVDKSVFLVQRRAVRVILGYYELSLCKLVTPRN